MQTKARMDEDMTKEYLKHIWQPYVEETAERLGLADHNVLLTLDSLTASRHTHRQYNIDVSINKPFKQILKRCWANFIHASVTSAADHTGWTGDWVVSAWQKMKERKDLIVKSFQVTGITSMDPGVVCRDDVLKRVMEAVQQEPSLSEESRKVEK